MGVWMNNIRPGQGRRGHRDRRRAAARGAARRPVGGGAPGVGRACSPGRAPSLTWAVMIYGFVASVLPVWLLLAPRDYLSAFLKIGTILVLGVAIIAADAAAEDAGGHAVHRRHRPGVRRQAVPVCVHHDRVRRDLRFPRAHLERHHAEDGDARERRAPDRLRLDADRVAGRPDGDDRGGDARSGRLLRDERRPRGARHDGGERGAGDRAVGLRAAAGADERARGADGRGHAAVAHRRRAEPGRRHGRHPRRRLHRRRPRALVSLRDPVRGGLHPDDDRRRHARRPLHAAGAARPRVRAARPHLLVSEHHPLVGPRRGRRGATSSTRASSIRSAASTRCGRCSASPTSCWPRSRSAWPRPSSSRWAS